jgi:hypothetical protein
MKKLLVAVLLVACSHSKTSSTTTPPPDPDKKPVAEDPAGKPADGQKPSADAPGISDADFKMAMDLMNKMAAVADADKDAACGKLADDLSKFADDNKASFDKLMALQKSGAKPTPDQSKQMMDAGMKMAPGMSKCAQDPKMLALAKRMGGGDAGGDQAAPPASQPTATAAAGIPDADFQSMMNVMTKLGSIADADKGNCDKMAADIGAWADANKDMVTKMQGMKNAQPSPDQMQKIMAVAPKMMGIDSCKDNPKMKELSKRFGGM